MSDLKKIKGREALRLLKEAMAVQGEDFVYNPDGGGCFYSPPSSMPSSSPKSRTGCIVGEALKLAGVDVGKLVRDRSIDDPGQDVLLRGQGFAVPRDALLVLGAAQHVQDNGGTWGEAVAEAEDVLRTLP